MHALTFLCGSLLAMLVARSELIVSVALQGSERQLLASRRVNLWQHVCVVDGTMRAVGGEDGRTHVSADLCWCEHARSARARKLLQRGRAAVPALVPAPHRALSTRDGVASSQCGEVVLTAVCAVLEEYVMLGLCAEVRHVVAVLGV